MGLNQIGYQGAGQLSPRINAIQPNAGPQAIVRFFTAQPVALQPGQSFVIPAGQWQVTVGRYSNPQYYDANSLRWRNLPTQPGQNTIVSSDGVNFRIANTTGTPIGALLTNLGAGNATNGYNTITVTVSAGNSTWGTLVGGSVNTTVTVTSAGNFQWAPHVIWQQGANQTFPYIPPAFYCNLNANGTINTVTCSYGGAGLTAAGTLTAVNVAGDNYPGNASLTLTAGLFNSGNLTALWPLTQGTGLTAVPTFSFNIGGGMAATAIMDFTVANVTVACAGFNYGASKPVTIQSGNGIVAGTQNTNIVGSDYGTGLAMPRMAWLTATTDANSNLSFNGTVVVQDGGKNLQAVPFLIVTASNANGNGPNGNNPIVLTAGVSGVNDTSYLQAM